MPGGNFGEYINALSSVFGEAAATDLGVLCFLIMIIGVLAVVLFPPEKTNVHVRFLGFLLILICGVGWGYWAYRVRAFNLSVHGDTDQPPTAPSISTPPSNATNPPSKP